MKGKILLLFFITILLSACQNNSQPAALNSETESKETTEVQSDPTNNEVLPMSIGNYDLKGEFYDEMLQNPIDRDYEAEFNEFQNSEEFTTLGWGALVGKYTEHWDKELNQIYNKLLSKLDREPKEALIASQKEWLKYHLKETEFVEKAFIDNGYLGSQGSVSLGTVIMGRIRERTMQLFEYRYLLDGEVEFLYQSNK
ncbi:lysozyme inhibitor LprI family protein [Paenibacillus sp. MMS20-IR301]|uniref:lysozyme inhibitor LprI family protein n=1 Tax=Paenibacillus sp. MMS20-IR301 TaxID=2895946 RepID=UPI0028E87A16|nr:lysozyme inhibitor LprI family protein [Paenibacillus sp. MMS20-IR301]WNS45451.1 lysozyme inhibitor LprI family protein [Paenibacillus sp. MMS20-IR301]